MINLSTIDDRIERGRIFGGFVPVEKGETVKELASYINDKTLRTLHSNDFRPIREPEFEVVA
jgi:hypothetical protein